MGLQLIFCVETNKQADTDWVYIMEAVRFRYKLPPQISLNKIYMETKSRYDSRKVLGEIDKRTKCFNGETKVIYCIDTDAYESNFEQKKEFEAIKQFCEKYKYDLIWFCHDVEEVFLGRRVENSQKKKEAGAFRSSRGIERVRVEKLSAPEVRNKCSNVLKVLDGYLEKK